MAELTIARRDGSVHIVLFDASDAELVLSHTWRISTPNMKRPDLKYAVAHVRKSNGAKGDISMHRLVMGHPAVRVDHINHDGLDNRRANLRLATGSQNGGNQLPKGGSSAYKGVSFHKAAGKWSAKFRNHHIGLFASEVDAAKAYDTAALEYWGDFALVNFPKAA